MTTPLRVIDFAIIGAPKCGTTSLHFYLSQHPSLFLPANKEPSFYATPGDASIPSWMAAGTPGSQSFQWVIADRRNYEALFAEAGDRLRGEASVFYLTDPDAPERVRRDNPATKAIAILRDPGLRAASAWKMHRRAGFETLRFAEAIRDNDRRASLGWDVGRQYVSSSRYASGLTRWQQALDPGNLLVLFLDDLKRDPHAVLTRTFEFLGVEPGYAGAIDLTPQQTGAQPSKGAGFVSALRLGRGTRSMMSKLPRGARLALRRVYRRTPLARPSADGLSPDDIDAVRAAVLAETVALERMLGVDLATWHPQVQRGSISPQA